jgi:hypothetical protein
MQENVEVIPIFNFTTVLFPQLFSDPWVGMLITLVMWPKQSNMIG